MYKQIKLIILFSLIIVLAVLANPEFPTKTRQLFKKTERRYISQKIISSCTGFNYVENGYARIYYTDEDSEYINVIKSTVDLYYPLLAADFGFEAPLAVIVIYPDEESMLSNINSSSIDAPMGAYYGGIINIISPRLISDGFSEAANKNFFLDKGPIIHELTHFLLDKKTNGNYEMWFSEGLALYYEYKYTAFEWRSDLKEQSKEIKLSQLRRNFRDLDEPSAYRRAFDIVNDIALMEGEGRLRDIVDILSGGGSIVYM